MKVLKRSIMVRLRNYLQDDVRHHRVLQDVWNIGVTEVWIRAERGMGIVLTYSGEGDSKQSWIGDVE